MYTRNPRVVTSTLPAFKKYLLNWLHCNHKQQQNKTTSYFLSDLFNSTHFAIKSKYRMKTIHVALDLEVN